MPATMYIDNPNSSVKYTFGDIPLFGRSTSFSRNTVQGAARRVTNITLSGFFAGNNHVEIMNQYADLRTILESGYAVLYYHDGSKEIFNGRVRLQSMNEPTEWRQYDGEYNIVMTSHDTAPNDYAEIGQEATFQNSNGTYVFNPIPSYSKSKKKIRQNPYAVDYAPSLDYQIAHESVITLDGFVTAIGGQTLKQRMDEIESAFELDGTLNYMGWSWPVKAGSFQWSNDTPIDYASYNIVIHHRDTDLYSIEVRRTSPRQHVFLDVKERPFCGTPYVRYFPSYVSGQEVRYSVKVEAVDYGTAEAILSAELARIIIPGGIEKDGGNQQVNETTGMASATVIKYYTTPVIANL